MFILIALSIVTAIFGILSLLCNHYRNHSLFVSNQLADSIAVCSRMDFENCMRQNPRQPVVVPATIVFKRIFGHFGDDYPQEQPPFSGYSRSGWKSNWDHSPVSFSSEERLDLFVPFVNSAVIDEREQVAMFAQRDPESFRVEKLKEMRKVFKYFLPQLAAAVERKTEPAIWFGFSLAALIVTILAVTVARVERENTLKPVVMTVTTPGSAEPTINKRSQNETTNLPLKDYEIGKWVYKGTVDQVMAVGGGQVVGCIKLTSSLRRCGFAVANTIKIGEKGYIRNGEVLRFAQGYDRSWFVSDWFVTKEEADALIKAKYNLAK